MSDGELGGDILFGLVFGTPLTYVVVVLIVCLLAGIGMGHALAVSILPCILSGVFSGGVFPLSRQMARHEAAERAERAVVVPLPHPRRRGESRTRRLRRSPEPFCARDPYLRRTKSRTKRSGNSERVGLQDAASVRSTAPRG